MALIDGDALPPDAGRAGDQGQCEQSNAKAAGRREGTGTGITRVRSLYVGAGGFRRTTETPRRPNLLLALGGDPLREQPLLGRIVGQAQRLLFGSTRLLEPAQPAQQLAPSGVEEVVAGQALGQRLDLGERRLAAVAARRAPAPG